MNYTYLLYKNLGRMKLRTSLTILSIIVAFLLYGVLFSVKQAFNAGVELSGQDRLVSIHKRSLTELLPISYLSRIRSFQDISSVTHATWFGGYYKQERNQVTTFAVDSESYLDVYDELLITDDEMKNWQENRSSVLVGEYYAKLHDWEVGQLIPLNSNLWVNNNTGKMTWDVTIAGIIKGREEQTDTRMVLLHYHYFNEGRALAKDQVGWYGFRVKDPSKNEILAKQIDEQFENTAAETKTSTEKAFADAFAKQLGDIGAIVTLVVGAVFFTILLIAGNTMALAARERTVEVAVLKTIGFPSIAIFLLVVSEALLITLIGGTIGLILSTLMVSGLQESLGSIFPTLTLTGETVIEGIIYMLIMGILTGILPALQMMRLNIVIGLRGG